MAEIYFNYEAYDSVLDLIYNAMISDSNSPIASKIKASLVDYSKYYQPQIIKGINIDADYSSSMMIAEVITNSPALVRWTEMVKSNAPWDYKKTLRDSKKLLRGTVIKQTPYLKIGSKYFFTPIRGDSEFLYFYDIWGNIHYGYVGSACGFTREYLEAGSSANNDLNGLVEIEAESDQYLVGLGIDLYKSSGEYLSKGYLHSAIYSNRYLFQEGATRITPDIIELDSV